MKPNGAYGRKSTKTHAVRFSKNANIGMWTNCSSISGRFFLLTRRFELSEGKEFWPIGFRLVFSLRLFVYLSVCVCVSFTVFV